MVKLVWGVAGPEPSLLLVLKEPLAQVHGTVRLARTVEVAAGDEMTTREALQISDGHRAQWASLPAGIGNELRCLGGAEGSTVVL